MAAPIKPHQRAARSEPNAATERRGDGERILHPIHALKLHPMDHATCRSDLEHPWGAITGDPDRVFGRVIRGREGHGGER